VLEAERKTAKRRKGQEIVIGLLIAIMMQRRTFSSAFLILLIKNSDNED
jgi:hypothetical protein